MDANGPNKTHERKGAETVNTISLAVRPHRIGALSRGRTGHLCPSATHAGAYGATAAASHMILAANDAFRTEQWVNTPKFGPSYHFQRWRFST